MLPRRTLSLLIALAALLASTPLWAVPPGRLFYAPFDGSLNATEARGERTGTPEGKPAFVAGHQGQALEVGDRDGSAGVVFPTAGNVNAERGTVSLWVCPVNWQAKDGLNHLFFRFNVGEHGFFLLYKYSSAAWGLAFLVDPDEGPMAKLPVYKPVDWQPGEWHHLAITWTRRDSMALYLDGQRVAASAGVELTDKPLQAQMTFGGAWQQAGKRTLLDEAMIFDRALLPEEIAQLAGVPASPPPVEATRDLPGVLLAQAVLSHKVVARVYRDALGAPLADEARLTLQAANATAPAATQTTKLTRDLTTFTLDTAALPPGDYEARVELRAGERLLGVECLPVSLETADTWETAARIGKEDVVLPPFTDLQTRGATVTACGPTWRFNGTALPESVRCGGEEMLAGPVRLVAETAAGPCPARAGALRTVRASAVQTTLDGETTLGGLRIRSEAVARYDATLWTTLTFQPQAAVELQRLRVEVPLRADQARYLAFIANARIDTKRWGYDRLPEGAGVVWSREFLPSLWLGTEDRGLGWYAESDEHWDLGDDALTIERRGDQVVLCLNLIRQPRRLDKEFRVAFGLQGTPVHPLAPDWRALQMVPSTDISRFFLSLRKNPYPRPDVEGKAPRGKVCYLYAYHQYFSNTLPRDPGEFREMIQRAQGYGCYTVPYTDTTYCPEVDGDYLLDPEMRSTPGAQSTSYGPVCCRDCCHQGRWGDKFVWYVSHLVRNYGTNGIYLDDMWPYGCDNPAHGCGYLGPDGKRHVTYPLRARLETYRRLRAVFAATGKPFYIMNHISAGRVPPLPTFGDGLLMAEDLNPIIGKNPDYTVSVSASRWLAGYSPEAWGIPPYVIPQFKMRGDWMQDPELAQRLLAAVVPHDLLLWPLFVDTETLMAVRAAQEAFGLGGADVKLLPYWHSGTGLQCAEKQLLVTGYLRPGKLLLCVANWQDDPVGPATVTLDRRALRLPAQAAAHDALTGEALALTDGALTLTVPGKRVRLIEVK